MYDAGLPCVYLARAPRAQVAITFRDCGEQMAEEQLCFDIAGASQCRNVSYPFVVCYFSNSS